MRRDSLDELTCAGVLHRRKLTPTNTIFKLASIAKDGAIVMAVKRVSRRGKTCRFLALG
jgi:hypothetical protein